MPVFKLYVKLLKKNRRSVATYMVIFLLLMMVFAFNGASSQDQFQAVKGQFTIIDHDHGKMSAAIKKELSQGNEFVAVKDNARDIQDKLFYRQVQVIITIPKNFTNDYMAGKDVTVSTMQVENSAASTMMKQELNSYLQKIKVYEKEGDSFTNAIDKASANQKIEAETSVLNSGNKQDTTFYYFFRYVPYILVSIILCGMSPVICSLQKKEIQKRNNCSSYSLRKMNLELVLGSFAFGAFCLVLIDGIGIIMWGNQASPVLIGYVFVNTLLQMLVSMSIAFCISMWLKSPNSINGAANIIGLGSSFLGGIFVPLSFLSKKIEMIAHCIPVYWYTRANETFSKSTILTASAKTIIYQSYFAQLLFAIAILILALIISKKRYSSAV